MKSQTSQQSQSSRPKFWGRRNAARGMAVLGLMACIATGTWAVEEAAKQSNVGLRGILPSVPPEELSADEFAKLDGNWADWSKGTAEMVADFYEKLETADPAAQREALKTLKAKLGVMQRSIDDPRYASLYDPLLALHARLARRIDFAEAALDTLEMDPASTRKANLANSAKAVTSKVDALESYLKGIQNGPMWLPFVKADTLRSALKGGTESDEAITAAKQVKERIAGRGTMAAGQKEFLGRPAFVALESAVDQYLAVVTATPAADASDELRAQLKNLSDAAEAYAVSLAKEEAAKVRTTWAAIRKTAPDGGERLSTALQKHLFNYNLRIVASEEFLNRLLADARTEKGPVVDNILGAAVSGQQTTATTVAVDLKPSANTARFNLNLNGTVQSSTVGVTSEATVYTSGHHTFLATKQINFDGHRFATSPGTIGVNPHNTTTGISTAYSGRLFGGIAQNVASQEVEARRGTAQAIAASRIQDRVLPKFNSEVDKAFGDASSKLEKELYAGLKSTNLYPDAYGYQSTDTTLRLNSRLMADGELGADTPQAGLATAAGATAMLHETQLNNAIDRIGLAGQTLNEEQLRAKIEAFLSQALSREVKISSPKKAPAAEPEDEEEKAVSAITFAETDPLRVHLDNGEVTLVIRASFKREGKDDVPMREIVAPISFEVKGSQILATRGSVKVSAADGEGGGLAINGVIRKKIQTVLPDRTLDGKVELTGPNNKKLVTHVSRIKVLGGWVAVSVK